MRLERRRHWYVLPIGIEAEIVFTKTAPDAVTHHRLPVVLTATVDSV